MRADWKRTLGVLALSLVGVNAARGETIEPPVSWEQLEALPLPPPATRIAYGPAPRQFGELRLPPGSGPHPVVVVLHGGCWLNAYDQVYITRLSERLTRERSVATWTLAYRRIGDPGGGWPGTLLDAASGVDHLRVLARTMPLDLTRVVSLGHSAGGQLALWLAARPRLPAGSVLHRADPLRIRGVIGLAAITDLYRFRQGPPGSCNSAVDELLAAGPDAHGERYAQSSPRALLPLGVPQWLVQGGRDSIVPAAGVRDYVEAAIAAGDSAQISVEPGAGHFDPVTPDSVSWPAVLRAVEQAIR